MLPPNRRYLCTKVLNIVTNDYNLIHQWHSKSRLTTVRLRVLEVVLPKVQVCWVVTKHFQGFNNCPYTWVRASWIEFNNCPKRCDLFSLLHFCRQLYMFRVWCPTRCDLFGLLHFCRQLYMFRVWCPTRCDLFSLLHFCRQLYMFRVWCPTRCDLFSLLHICRQLYMFRVWCPTRCDLFCLLHFCRQLYMFRV